MNLPHYALSRKVIILAIAALLTAWGLRVFLHAPRREDPEYRVRTALVICVWPGATVQNMELLVTDPIEEAISSVESIEEIRSTSRVGRSYIYVDVEESVHDVDNVWDELAANLEHVELPIGAAPPVLNRQFGDTSVMLIALHAKEGTDKAISPADLYDVARRVRDRISVLPDVSATSLHGVRREAIYVHTDLKTWGQLGITTTDLQRLVQTRNIVASGGNIDSGLDRFAVNPTGSFDTISDLERLIVGPSKTHPFPSPLYPAPVLLHQTGLRVERAYEDPPTTLARFGKPGSTHNSTPAIYISFLMKKGANVTVLGRKVRALLEQMEQTILPPHVAMTVIANQPDIVEEKIENFLSNLVQAVTIVIIVAFLLIGLRMAMVMASAIPVVMFISIGLSRFLGVQLEQVSIASLIIALGMLVDNAIEVGDNTLRFLENGEERWKAATEGPRQVGGPMLFGTLTTVAAFAPMLTIPGATGEFIYSLPVVVSLTLLTSWLVAMTFTSIMCYWLMRAPATGSGIPLARLIGWVSQKWAGKSRPQKQMDTDFLRRAYGRLCELTIAARWVVVPAAFLIFAFSVWLAATGRIGTQFFPPNYRAQFTIDVHTPEGSSIAGTNAVVQRVEALLHRIGSKEKQKLLNYMVLVGQGGPRFYTSLAPEPPASNYAFILVNTTAPEHVDSFAEDMRRAAMKEIPGSRVIPRTLMNGPPVAAPIALRYLGENADALRGVARRVEKTLRATPGTWDVHDSWGRWGYQLKISVEEDRANLAGVTNAAISQSLKAYYSGHPLGIFREGEKRIPIYFRLNKKQRHSIQDISRIFVEGRKAKIPLDAVASVSTLWQPAKIQRQDGQRMIEVRARVTPGHLANSVLAEAMPRIQKIHAALPPGMWMEVAGERSETTQSQGNVLNAFYISLICIVLLLIVKYNALGKPLLILLTAPLAAAGGLLGLYIMHVPLGFMANLGMLSLVGIIVNGAIVLVEFIEILARDAIQQNKPSPADSTTPMRGLSRQQFRDIIVQAGRIRLLPILLTALTTVGGLLPLLLFGGPMWAPLAIVLIFGLLLGTALTLLVFPAAFVIAVEVLHMPVIKSV